MPTIAAVNSAATIKTIATAAALERAIARGSGPEAFIVLPGTVVCMVVRAGPASSTSFTASPGRALLR